VPDSLFSRLGGGLSCAGVWHATSQRGVSVSAHNPRHRPTARLPVHGAPVPSASVALSGRRCGVITI